MSRVLRRLVPYCVSLFAVALLSLPGLAQKLVVNLDHVSEEIAAVIARDFEAAHPGVTVEIVPKGDQNIARIVAGQQLDVWQMDIGSGYVDLIRQGLLRELDPYLERHPDTIASWAPPILETQKYEGKTYLLPRGDVGLYMTWTNRTMFERSGLAHPTFDWTHDDFVDIARKIRLDTNGDGEYDQWAYSFDSYYAWRTWFENRGGKIVDPDDPTRLAIGTPESMAALLWMEELVEEGLVPPRSVVTDGRGSYISGRLAMAQGEARKVVPSVIDREWEAGVTIDPAGPAGQALMMTWQGFAISSTSDHPDLAWEFIRHVTQPRYQALYITELFSPTVNMDLNAELFGADVTIPGFQEAYYRAFQHNLILAVPTVPWDVFNGFDSRVMTHIRNASRSVSHAVLESIDALQSMLTAYYAK